MTTYASVTQCDNCKKLPIEKQIEIWDLKRAFNKFASHEQTHYQHFCSRKCFLEWLRSNYKELR